MRPDDEVGNEVEEVVDELLASFVDDLLVLEGAGVHVEVVHGEALGDVPALLLDLLDEFLLLDLVLEVEAVPRVVEVLVDLAQHHLLAPPQHLLQIGEVPEGKV
eukprot:CAMPEP_0170561926 /NCGR_PEP_ID=MMETSP0211-20121228/57848_1 /TAXON_ID=311385 /ORGANISM="Pseudokeronopsis sp., Strain OXSARD2" /LENGTH=103 /DNA_ID=CAMNT_0010878153 /DNA_START=522 /DNA_END=830 /DNA_ORIENTATION=-